MGILGGSLAAGIAAVFCVVDLGSYVDEAGRVNFAFANRCEEDVWLTLCVKTWPVGRRGPAFDAYVKTVGGGATVNIAGGFWDEIEGYVWNEGAGQSCP